MFEGNYVFYLTIVIIVGGLASYFTNIGLKSDKYKSSKKPSWYPPGIVFAIAWSFIYLLYSYSWTKASYYPGINLLFSTNMVLNFSWCFIFFYLEYWSLALATLISLCLVLILQIYSFYKYNIFATILLIPYLLWSLFASYLNYTVISMN
jgi:benzodiazapine receptor